MRKQLGYSEFSFGYAFTENLVRSSAKGPATAPRFPNLQEEAQLGFDVEVDVGGAPLFLQYKLPEPMVRSTAAEIKNHKLHGHGLSVPFLRMAVTRRNASQQHELLVGMAQKDPGSVFYAMPRLESRQAFNSAYAALAVHRRSVLFSPAEIGLLPDDEQHTVAYDLGSRRAWFCSEPRPVEAREIGSILAERGRAAMEAEGGLAAVARAVSDRIQDARGGELEEVARVARERARGRREAAADTRWSEAVEEAVEELVVARELARVGLGVEFLVAQRRG